MYSIHRSAACRAIANRLCMAALLLGASLAAAHHETGDAALVEPLIGESRLWAAVLAERVESVGLPDGAHETRVDWFALKDHQDDRRRITKFLEALGLVEWQALADAERLASAINGYNALIADLVIEELRADPHLSNIYEVGDEDGALYRRERLAAAGRRWSANDWERHFVLGEGHPDWPLDPRAHFVVNCASLGCPSLLAEPIDASTLDAQLDAAVQNTLANPRHLRFDPANRELWVSPLFGWYAADFGGAQGVRAFLARYAPPPVAAALKADPQIAVRPELDWDWTLNAVLSSESSLEANADRRWAGRPVHTYSIVAHDPATGELGVAVQSHWFSVGPVVPWVEAGVGAVATQSLVDVSYGPLALELLRAGKSPAETLAALTAADSGRALRQVAIVDARGRVAAHTGERCIAAAGHRVGEHYSVQANLMAKDTVWPAMAQAYEAAEEDLAERLLVALEAAEAEGGDIRGRQSAALIVASGTPTGVAWQDIEVELRVEDHPEPLVELRRLLGIHRAYEHMNKGDELIGAGDTGGALAAYSQAASMAPDIVELPFWQAVTLWDAGRLEDALPVFEDVFRREPVWATLLPRLLDSGLIPDDADELRRILELAPR